MLQGGTRKVQFLAIIKAIVYIVKRCANYVMGNDDKIKHQIIELDLGHFDETGIV